MTDKNPKDEAAFNRVPLHLIPPAAAIEEAMALRDGAIKYGIYNWREKSISFMEYLGAIERHIARLKDGQIHDTHSGETHLGHIRATSGILIDAYHSNNLKDDRPKRSAGVDRLLTDLEQKMINQSR